MHPFKSNTTLPPSSSMAHLAVGLKETEEQMTSLPRTLHEYNHRSSQAASEAINASQSRPQIPTIMKSSQRSLMQGGSLAGKPFWTCVASMTQTYGTMLQIFISGLLGVGLTPTATETSVGPVFTVSLAAIANVFVITLFIYTAGPITGAHFNPLITMATFFTRLSSLPRTILYILFQCTGAVVGAFIVRASLGASSKDLVVVPGCYVDTSTVTPGEA
jgi:hypothetical protein